MADRIGDLAAQDTYGDERSRYDLPVVPDYAPTDAVQNSFQERFGDFPSSPVMGELAAQEPYRTLRPLRSPARARDFGSTEVAPFASALGDIANKYWETVKTPGSLLWNEPQNRVEPEVPGYWSDRDEARAALTAGRLTLTGMATGLETMNPLGRPVAGTLFAGGKPPGRVSAPLYRGEPMGSIGEQVPVYRGYPAETADVTKLQPRNITKYVDEPQRVLHPGVYKNPRAIAQEAGANVAPEHPALKQLFGVTREDLYDIGGRGTRQGNVDPNTVIWAPENPRGSYAAEAIMNKRNAQRMIDAMAEAERYPELTHGMKAWYVMDPMFQQMERLVGREQAIKDYTRYNAVSTPFSSNANVLSEINRGSAANMMAARGEFPAFARYAGVRETERGADFPDILRDVASHVRHSGHIPPVQRYLETGTHGFAQDTVKNPLYSLASGVPETGFQTSLPVPDAHFARASGMADVRKNADPGSFMAGSEYRTFGPWYRENVAKPLGIEAVPAQGNMWGVFGPQTGVKTLIGAPKLELLAQSIWERAQRLGIDPRVLRDHVLTGKGHAVLPIAGSAGALGALAAQDQYAQ